MWARFEACGARTKSATSIVTEPFFGLFSSKSNGDNENGVSDETEEGKTSVVNDKVPFEDSVGPNASQVEVMAKELADVSI